MFRRRTLVASDSYLDEYLTFVAEESGTFRINKEGLSYSLDNGSTWTALSANTNTPTVSAGSRIMWKRTTPDGTVGRFFSTGNFEVNGNVMSLVYGDNFRGKTTLTVASVFSMLFMGCKKLTKADKLKLPATTLAAHCYQNMFASCSNLTTAPELPATTLTNNCYGYMFSNCTSLTTAPELPATTLTNNCYQNMFSACSSLNYIKVAAKTRSSDYDTALWLSNVASSGTFYKNATAPASMWTTNSADGIPSGWTVQTYTP